MALTKSEKAKQLAAHKNCYVCHGLNLQHASLKGYGDNHIQFDHYKPKSLVGDRQADLVGNQLPIHAVKGGDDYRNPHYAKSTKRNCHVGKSNQFSGEEWVEFIGMYRRAAVTDYSDQLFAERKATDKNFEVSITWDEKKREAKFNGRTYPLMEQDMGNNNSWVSFSTVVSPELLWVDHQVQSRPADKERMADLAWHLRTKPLLAPILCRYSDNKLKVFDGNHRLCAFVLARANHAVPVTIFKGPEPDKFLEVVAEAHDRLTQKKYQYSDKALKYSGVSESELKDAFAKHGNEASEVKAWAGLSKAAVKVRLVGRVTQGFEDHKKSWRQDWRKHGLTDASFSWMVGYYSKTDAETKPFSSDDSLRESELLNLIALFSAFDEELFRKLGKHPKAKASLKTKWWKLAHKRFRTQLSQLVRNSLKLPNTPEKPAYAPEWDSHIKSQVVDAVCAWRDSPVWAGDTTANNEPDVDAALARARFTESYLFS